MSPAKPPVSSSRRRLSHVLAAGVFAALAVTWTFPLARHLSTTLPGSGPGDNIDFLWNFWWMRTALAAHLDVFHTTYLFAPTGADLTLHTHTALPAFVGATVLGGLSIVAAQNVMILTALALNGFCAYLLAWRATRDHGGALVAGIVFGGSPYISAHLNGHFNLTSAWTIPLFAIAASEAIRGSMRWAMLAGLLLGATAYLDYYYLVYEIALVLCLVALAACDWSIVWRDPGRVWRRPARVVGVLLLLDLVAMGAIWTTGGFTAEVGPIRISARGLFNPLQAFWILLALFLWLRFGSRLEAKHSQSWASANVAHALPVMTVACVVTAAPLLWKGFGLFLRGEYVTQEYFWRSAPKGVDLATLVLGSPFHGIWGEGIRQIYRTLGIDAIESTGWLGVVPIVLAAWSLRRYLGQTSKSSAAGPTSMSISSTSSTVRQWAAIGMVFFIWALGPHLMVFGTNTGVILPQTLLRYLPIVGNARVPGRAMVVVYLALAVLTAVAVAEWRSRFRRGVVVPLAVALILIADYVPAPFPVMAMTRPAIYDTLRNRPESGAVCELPLGIRHGLGSRGMLDDRVLFYQTIHQRPLVGGFIARLPRAVAAAYEADPLLAALLNLSEGDNAAGSRMALPDRQMAADRLRRNGVSFVVLNRGTASPALIQYVEQVLPLALIDRDGDRSLYLVLR